MKEPIRATIEDKKYTRVYGTYKQYICLCTDKKKETHLFGIVTDTRTGKTDTGTVQSKPGTPFQLHH